MLNGKEAIWSPLCEQEWGNYLPLCVWVKCEIWWGKKQKVRKVRLSFWDDVSRSASLWRRVLYADVAMRQADIVVNTKKHGGYLDLWHRARERASQRKTVNHSKTDKNRQKIQATEQRRGGVKNFGGMSTVSASRPRQHGIVGDGGIVGTEYKKSAESVRDRHSQARVKTLERCQVFLLLFWVSCGRARLNSEKKKKAQTKCGNFVLVPPLCGTKRKEKDIKRFEREERPQSDLLCWDSVFVCKQRSTLTWVSV